MVSFLNGTIDAKLMGRTDIGSISAYATVFTSVAVYIPVAFITIHAVQSRIDGTFLAEDHSLFNRAVFTGGNALDAPHAFLAPSLHLEVTASAFMTMALALCRTILAEKTVAEIDRACVADVYAFFADSAFLAPGLNLKITCITLNTVLSLIDSAFDADGVADLHGGATVASFDSRTLGALSAFDTKLIACITYVAFAAIRRSVDPIITFGTCMTRMRRHRKERYRYDSHSKNEQRTQYFFRSTTLHFLSPFVFLHIDLLRSLSSDGFPSVEKSKKRPLYLCLPIIIYSFQSFVPTLFHKYG